MIQINIGWKSDQSCQVAYFKRQNKIYGIIKMQCNLCNVITFRILKYKKICITNWYVTQVFKIQIKGKKFKLQKDPKYKFQQSETKWLKN